MPSDDFRHLASDEFQTIAPTHQRIFSCILCSPRRTPSALAIQPATGSRARQLRRFPIWHCVSSSKCSLRQRSRASAPLHSRDAPLSPAPEGAICRVNSHLPFAFWTILYQNKTGSSSSEKIHSRMSDWMRFFVIAPAMISSFHSHELYQMPPIL